MRGGRRSSLRIPSSKSIGLQAPRYGGNRGDDQRGGPVATFSRQQSDHALRRRSGQRQCGHRIARVVPADAATASARKSACRRSACSRRKTRAKAPAAAAATRLVSRARRRRPPRRGSVPAIRRPVSPPRNNIRSPCASRDRRDTLHPLRQLALIDRHAPTTGRYKTPARS